MPWCPKCKTEYREGFRVCADCGSELVDDEQFREMESRELEDRQRFFGAAQAHLAEALADAAELEAESEHADGAELKAESENAERIEPEAEGAEPASEPEEAAEQGNKTASSRRPGSGGLLYQDSMERANENRSSAWVLLAMGGIGILVIVLGILGIVPLRFSNPYLFYGVMAAVFLLFLVAGIVSMKNARFFDKKAESENSLRSTMLAWCRENLRAQALNEEIGMDGSESEEALYFRRFECIKAKLNYQFVNLDQGFLEKFIDDCVYDMVFGGNEESL